MGNYFRYIPRPRSDRNFSTSESLSRDDRLHYYTIYVYTCVVSAAAINHRHGTAGGKNEKRRNTGGGRDKRSAENYTGIFDGYQRSLYLPKMLVHGSKILREYTDARDLHDRAPSRWGK